MARSDELLDLANRIDAIADDVQVIYSAHGLIPQPVRDLHEITQELRDYVRNG